MKDPNTQRCETSVLLLKDREQEIPNGLLQGLPRKTIFLIVLLFLLFIIGTHSPTVCVFQGRAVWKTERKRDSAFPARTAPLIRQC